MAGLNNNSKRGGFSNAKRGGSASTTVKGSTLGLPQSGIIAPAKGSMSGLPQGGNVAHGKETDNSALPSKSIYVPRTPYSLLEVLPPPQKDTKVPAE